jgi:peptidoglycan/xylan/chitin deacetylase (PgdA/CDA1 family)
VTPLLLAGLMIFDGPPVLPPPCPGRVLWTFDDGPSAISTPRILDVLRRYKIRGTVWFVLGGRLWEPAQVAALRRVVAEGHYVAPHLWSHRSPCDLSRRDVLRELWLTAARIRRLVPVRSRLKWYRPPYGALCHARRVQYQGWRLAMWHVQDLGRSPEYMATRIMRRSERGKETTVLLHHNWRRLESVLALLKARGCLGRGTTDGDKPRGTALP